MKNILILTCFCAGSLITGCTRNNLDIPNAADYIDIYMPQAYQYPNQQNVFVIDSPQVITCNAYFGGPAAPGNNITVHFAADTALADSFNLANGTQYAVMPPGSYEIDTTQVIIPTNRLNSSSLNIIIHPQGLKVNQSYLLPITITGVSGNYKINDQMKTTYFLISGGYPPGEVVPWNNFNFIMPYAKDWLVVNTKGELWDYPTDAAGNFGPPYQLATGWDQYDVAFISRNSIISRKTSDGSLWETPIAKDMHLGEIKQIGWGWGNVDMIFDFNDGFGLISHAKDKDGGDLTLFNFNENWDYTSSGVVGWGWFNLKTIIGCDGALMAVSPDGTMTRYPLDDFGNYDWGNIGQVGTGFNAYNLLIYNRYTNSIVGRKPDGTLWGYLLDSNNVPGLPVQIGTK